MHGSTWKGAVGGGVAYRWSVVTWAAAWAALWGLHSVVVVAFSTRDRASKQQAPLAAAAGAQYTRAAWREPWGARGVRRGKGG